MSLKHAPGALPDSLDKVAPLPPKAKKSVTKPKAFDFATQSRSQSRMFTFSNVTAGKMEFGGKKSSEAYMKKALKGHSAVVPEQREATVPKTVRNKGGCPYAHPREILHVKFTVLN